MDASSILIYSSGLLTMTVNATYLASRLALCLFVSFVLTLDLCDRKLILITTFVVMSSWPRELFLDGIKMRARLGHETKSDRDGFKYVMNNCRQRNNIVNQCISNN